MLTVCLHRLGDSPTLWFLIRHMMRRREIGIWAEDCCMGQTDLIVFAFHLPALMETILIHASHCHPCSKTSQVENTCISHSCFNKPWQLPYKDGGRLYFLCWLNRMSTQLPQWKQKMEKIIKSYMSYTSWRWIFQSLQWNHEHNNNKLFNIPHIISPIR